MTNPTHKTAARLIDRFMAYRATPKPKLPTEAVVVQKKYPHSGFLTTDETKEERMERLVEAKARGYWLENDDIAFLKMHRSFGCTIRQRTIGRAKYITNIDRDSHIKSERKINHLFLTSQPMMRG